MTDTGKESVLDVFAKLSLNRSLQSYTGSDDFASLVVFVQGFAYGLRAAGLRDVRYAGFCDWLGRRSMNPTDGGWFGYFLRTANGSSPDALVLFLECVRMYLSEESVTGQT